MAYDLIARISLKAEKFTGPLQKVISATKNFQSTADQAAKAAGGIASGSDKAARSLRRMAAEASGIDSFAKKAITATAALGGMALAGKGLTAAFKGASDMESNMISIEHFIGLTQGAEKAKGAAKEYVEYLRQNANLTPFSTGDVMDAGRRSINIATGNIPQAKKLLGIAEDMAALNPGKTLMDAMEALADLKTGETERMKEFGFKISQDDIKRAGGAMNIINGQVAKTFAGGAGKLSTSTSGMWSTITGTFSSGLADAGTKALEKLRGPMSQIAASMSAGSFDKFFGKAGDMLGNLVDKALAFGNWIEKIKPQASAVFSDIATDLAPIAAGFDTVGTYAKTAAEFVLNNWGEIKPFVYGVVGAWTAWTAAQWALNVALTANPIGLIVTGIGLLVAGGYQLVKHWDDVKKAAGTLWDGLKSMFASGVNWVIDKMNGMISGINKIPGVEIGLIPHVGDSSGGTPTKRAGGLNRVPYNGMPIIAHKDEMLLTKAEGDAYRSGRGGSNLNVTINATVRSDDDIDRLIDGIVRKLEAVY